MELIRDKEKAVIIKAEVLWEKARAEQDGWSLYEGVLVYYGRLWVPNKMRRIWLIKEVYARPGAAYCGVNKLRRMLFAWYY